jgi:hypothetical protein
MPPRIRLLFSTLNLALFLVAAVPLYGELSRRSDIWWTPERLPLLLVCAAGCGITACMLLLVLTGRLAYRGERER